MIKDKIDLMLANIPEDFGARTIEVSLMHKKTLGKSYKGLEVDYNPVLPEEAITIR